MKFKMNYAVAIAIVGLALPALLMQFDHTFTNPPREAPRFIDGEESGVS